MTLREYIKVSANDLVNLYDETEAQNIIYMILEHYYDLPKLKLITRLNETLENNDLRELNNYLSSLKEGIPVQYVLGEAHFYGLTFKVNDSVLIPRPETEELVDRIIKNNKIQSPRIIDLCTGSGCIAISLASNIKGSELYAVDISERALAVAEENSNINQTSVQFIKADVLSEFPFPNSLLDIIVSNPPYVLNEEKQEMRGNVLDHEPHLALFVEDSDPLLFYRAILKFAQSHLKSGGFIYFEINESQSENMKELTSQYGFENILLFRDLNEKWRILQAQKI